MGTDRGKDFEPPRTRSLPAEAAAQAGTPTLLGMSGYASLSILGALGDLGALGGKLFYPLPLELNAL